MEVTLSSEVAPKDWRALLAGLRATPLHLPEVVAGEAPGLPRLFAVVKEGGRVVAAGVGSLLVRRAFRILVRGRTFFAPTALARAPETDGRRGEIYRAFLDALAARGVDRVRLGHAWGEDFSDDPSLALFVEGRFVDFEVDLDADDEAILARMRRNHRRNVRQAIKKGVTTAEEAGEEAFLLLRELQEEAAARQRDKDNPFHIGDVEHYRRLYRDVYGTPFGRTRIARLEGEPVGAVSVLELDGRAIETRSACNERGYGVNAAYLLKYATCRDVAGRGGKVLNLSAVPEAAREEGHPEHGLYAFKEGFGGRETTRTALRIDVRAFRRGKRP